MIFLDVTVDDGDAQGAVREEPVGVLVLRSLTMPDTNPSVSTAQSCHLPPSTPQSHFASGVSQYPYMTPPRPSGSSDIPCQSLANDATSGYMLLNGTSTSRASFDLSNESLQPNARPRSVTLDVRYITDLPMAYCASTSSVLSTNSHSPSSSYLASRSSTLTPREPSERTASETAQLSRKSLMLSSPNLSRIDLQNVGSSRRSSKGLRLSLYSTIRFGYRLHGTKYGSSGSAPHLSVFASRRSTVFGKTFFLIISATCGSWNCCLDSTVS